MAFLSDAIKLEIMTDTGNTLDGTNVNGASYHLKTGSTG